MSEILLNLGVVLIFTLIGGFFAASEIALVSLRDSQVARLAETGGKRGLRLKILASNSNRFLAAVQVGVTLASFLSAGFGASRITPLVAEILVGQGLSAGVADPLSFVGVTVVLVYLSLVFGELTPKRLGLQRAEALSMAVVNLIELLARVSRPFIWLLGHSTDVVVRVLGGDPNAQREQISSEELRDLVVGHQDLAADQRSIVEEVFAAGERLVREVMIPRTEVAFLDAETPVFKAVRIAAELPHSRYPVTRDSHDDVIGFVHVRDLFDPDVATRGVRVGELIRTMPHLPGTVPVLAALQQMRRAGSHLAIVEDEYGGTAGIVTLEDLVEELVGEIRDEYDQEESGFDATPSTGPVEVDGLLNADDFAELTGLQLPDGPYETVAGFMVAKLGHLPKIGDCVDLAERTLTVLALDGRRVARIAVTAHRVHHAHGAPEGVQAVVALGGSSP